MTDPLYDALVSSWTRRALDDLPAARTAAMRWAMLAIAVVPLMMIMSLLVAAIGIGGGIAIAAGGVGFLGVVVGVVVGGAGLVATWEIVRCVAVRLLAPDGLRVSRTEMPELWRRVDAVAASVGADSPDVIVLERGFTAYAAWHAPYPFARSSTWIGVGLAAFALFEPDELDAVLAHELAHIHHKDGAALRRTRRALVTWDRLEWRLSYRQWRAAQSDAGYRDRLTGWLLRWTLVPLGTRIVRRLSAIERGVARVHELAADRISARAVSPQAAARALIRAETRLIEWGDQAASGYSAALCNGEQPDPELPITTARQAAEGPDVQRARLYLAQSLIRPDEPSDEHPPLSRRLAELGVAIDSPAALQISFEDAVALAVAPTSDTLWNDTFGSSSGERILTRMGEEWRVEQGESWEQSQTAAIKHERETRELAARAHSEQLTAGQYLRLVHWSRMHGEYDNSRTWIQHAAAADSEHAPAVHMLGRMLLGRGDASGLVQLERAGQLAPELMSDSIIATAAWHRAAGDIRHADELVARQRALVAEHGAIEPTHAALINDADPLPASPTEREASILRHATRDVPELVGIWVGRLDVHAPPLGRPPIGMIVQLRTDISSSRFEEIRASIDQTLGDEHFASGFDQWFTMYNPGPCPPNTLGGRLEGAPWCRVPDLGVDDDELARITAAAGGMRQSVATFFTKERSLLGRRAA